MPTCILHVGMPKTGTSSIQESLYFGLADPGFRLIGLGDANAVRFLEPLFGDEYEVYENERRIEAALLDLLATEGVARLGGQEDGLPVKRGNGHRIAGSSSYCDLLLVLPDERVVAGTVLGRVLLWSPSEGANAMVELGTPGPEVVALAALDGASLAVLGADGVVRRVDLPAAAAP